MKIYQDIENLPKNVPLYIFGASEGGMIVKDVITRINDLNLAGFIDSNKNGMIDGFPILSPVEFFSKKPDDAVVLVASQYHHSISKKLIENEFPNFINMYPFIYKVKSGNCLIKTNEKYSSEEYWTEFNVTSHHIFGNKEESLKSLEWRNLQYLGYEDFMPTHGCDGKVVLDYGCGPGHDLTSFAERSRPARLIAMDVSHTSLAEARHRLSLHDKEVEWVKISETLPNLPLPDASVDVVHSSGVLHHTPNPLQILKEFRRVLAPGGHGQIMVYNYDSVFMHLHIAYLEMLVEGKFPGLTLGEAFQRSTDGANCPISVCYRPDEFIALCREAGFKAELTGVAVAMLEMQILPKRFDALLDTQLPSEHRRFLYELTFDEQGCPLYRGVRAGIDACFRLEPL